MGLYGECTGNFQNRERMQLQKAARIRYGRFFYRFPNGESAADVYDRITGKFWFLLSHNGSLWWRSWYALGISVHVITYGTWFLWSF